MLSNYGISDVARSHKLLKHSSLSDERKDDLLLQLNFDLARYDELRRLLEKLAKSKQPNQLPIPHGTGGNGAHFADSEAWCYVDSEDTWYSHDQQGYVYFSNDYGEGYYNKDDEHDGEYWSAADEYQDDSYYDEYYDGSYEQCYERQAPVAPAAAAASAAHSAPAAASFAPAADLSWAATDWSDGGWDWSSCHDGSTWYGMTFPLCPPTGVV